MSLLSALINPFSPVLRAIDDCQPQRGGYAKGFVDGQRAQARYDRTSSHGHHHGRTNGHGGSHGSNDCGFNGGGYGNFGGYGGYGDYGGYGGYGGYGDYGYGQHRGNGNGHGGGQHGYHGGYGSHGYPGMQGHQGSGGTHGHYGQGHSGHVNGHGGSSHANAKPLIAQKDGDKGIVTTAGGYKIEGVSGGDEGGSLKITAPNGKTTEIWGDPHVKVDGVLIPA